MKKKEFLAIIKFVDFKICYLNIIIYNKLNKNINEYIISWNKIW